MRSWLSTNCFQIQADFAFNDTLDVVVCEAGNNELDGRASNKGACSEAVLDSVNNCSVLVVPRQYPGFADVMCVVC